MQLNETQRTAVTEEGDIILVNSVVGSGKTTVLTHKIWYICENLGVSPDTIMVLSYTRKAANEINERLRQSSENFQIKYCGTFHSVANQLLRDHFDLSTLGYTNEFIIIDEPQKLQTLWDICSEQDIRVKKYDLLNLQRSSQKTKKLTKIWRLYEDHKRQNNVMDFDDLIVYCDRLLNSQALSFSWIIVDEFQDTDDLQASILKKLIGYGAKLFAVGDPHQTIYSWRGSSPEIFQDFLELPGAKQISLSLNYRSTATILEGAKEVIENKSLKAFRDIGKRIVIKQHHNAFHEATYLAHKIKDLNTLQQISCENIAVLYRRQAQREVLEDVFAKEKIPFTPKPVYSIHEIPILEWFYTLLSLGFNPKNQMGFRFVLNHPQYGAKNFSERRALIEKIEGISEFLKTTKTFAEVWEYLQISSYVSPTSLNFSKEQAYMETFYQEICPFEFEEFNLIKENILLHNYNLQLVVNQVEEYKPGGVNFLTIHASKGLQFLQVFIIGTNEGNIPLKAEESDEEKRLFFVAITRAQDYLEISFLKNPELYGVEPNPSRYLQLFPHSVVEKHIEDATNHDLQKLTKEVKDSIHSKQQQPNSKKAYHEKYGEGIVIHEDDASIIVDFPGYGEKSFSPFFCPLKFD